MSEAEPVRVGLMPVNAREGKDFLPFYMAYRTETETRGIEFSPSTSRYARFWGEPRTDLAFWIMVDDTRAGFLSVGTAQRRWVLEDLYVSREHRGKGVGLQALERLLEIASYRSVDSLGAKVPSGTEGYRSLLAKAGFSGEGDLMENPILPF